MSKRRMAESGEVHVYVNETADVAILTMPVREAVMLMALAGKCGNVGPTSTFTALCDAFGWRDEMGRSFSWFDDLYARFGFKEPCASAQGSIIFEETP